MKNFYHKYKKSCIVITSFSLIVLFYTLFGFFGIPWLITDIAPKFIADKNATLEIKEAKFHPYKFELNATKISLKTYNDLFRADSIDASLNFKEIFSGNVNVDVFRLTNPFINITRDRELGFNFEPLVASKISEDNASNQADNESFFNFTLNLFEIINGGAQYADMSLKEPFVVSFNDLSYTINDINLKEYSAGKHDLDTSSSLFETFDWSGGVSLNPLKIYGDVKFSGLKMNKIWQSYINQPDINITKGTLDAKLNYELSLDNGVNINVNKAKLQANEFEVLNLDANISFDKFSLDDISLNGDFVKTSVVDVKIGKTSLDKISFKNAEIAMSSDKIYIDDMLIRARDDFKSITTRLPKFGLSDIKFKGYDTELSQSVFEFNELSTLVFLKDSDAKIVADLKNFNSQTSVIKVAEEKLLNIDSLNANELKFDNERLALGSFDAKKSDLFSRDKVFGGLDKLSLEDVSFNLKENILDVKNIKVLELFYNDEISKNGAKAINNLAILKKTSAKQTDKKAATANNDSKKQFVANVKNIEIINAKSNITQGFLPSVLTHEIVLKNAKIGGFSSDLSKPFDINASITSGEKVDINLKGNARLEPLKSDLNIKLNSKLKELNKISKHYINGFIAGGNLSVDANVKFDKSYQINSHVNLDDIVINDSNNLQIINLKNAKIKNINLNENGVKIDGVTINSPHLRAHVDDNKSLNLALLAKVNSQNEAKKELKSKSADKFGVQIQDVALNDMSVDFSDASLVLPFLFKIKNLNAKVDNIRKNTISEITSSGTIGKGGSANVQMRINALEPKKFSDISLKFKDIELNEVTPYSATFVGRKIEGGVLDLSLVYNIEDSQMKGDNGIRIDTIKLGESVESPSAVSLPLQLAISVLQDSNNVIKLNLPVGGDLENPEFSYGGIVLQAIMQIFTDVVTSPFRLIGNMLGVENADELASIDFTAGSDEMMKSQMKKIDEFKKITDAKKDINLIITPSYDEEVDRYAVQKRLFDRDVMMASSKTNGTQDEVIRQMAARQFKNQPTNAYEALVRARKIDEDTLDKLAKNRAQKLKQAMIDVGISADQIVVLEKIQAVKAQMDLYVPIPMGVENK
ncbi:DUF748 domain-containing protein [Campylobacter sp. RM9328]|uniref:DUF748 domain-containing protein n=1 Tax=Campylobacter sp. RM9328 TaxID=1705720 RepID=UPI0014747382|nr:DUF748 domain-containing protein [Campylobacter sp. RM9328]